MEMIKQWIKSIRYFLRRIVNGYCNPLYKIDTVKLFDKTYKIYKGTFGGIDKDDAWYATLVRDAKVIFDIGANVGWTALLAHVYGSPLKVVLIDPNPNALAYAAGNMIMNDFSENSIFIKSFVADKVGEKVKFFTVDVGAAGSMYSSHAKTASSLNSWYWVSTITVDELTTKLNIFPDLIKIDVEGAEHLVLLGASKLCSLNKVKVFVEMHSNRELSMAKNAELILSWCAEQGYKAWYLTTGDELITPSQIASRGRCHLLLLPSSYEYPVQFKSIKQGDALPSL
ncbi:MAG: FkbM family methyltransferase [Cyclobacteriaceae bacterium]|nr:FkbM family methyltransferase [Cyclobacteriaceae bacterium]